MVLLAQKALRKVAGNWTFVVVTDHVELASGPRAWAWRQASPPKKRGCVLYRGQNEAAGA